jgi:hypothetical protein
MKHIVSSFSYPVVIMLAFLFLFVDIPYNIIDIPFVKDAEAIAGRPATPGSVAGVRRRTRRRVIAIGTRATVLPVGHAPVVVHGVTYYHHEGVYYQPHYEGTTVVYVVVDKPQ